ncbi:GUN4 domain-containing protein [Microseira sp. BLCC-F43]|jgi:uncharacterized caspase-like protein|uniref:GUN4 domain-containing protein n=1 Tax=Microseira sp. BLCC-F43 TaxID=3153602 RepID=UPI0035B76611
MAKNWAITIGINQYEFLQPLNYAKRDAQLMHDFLRKEAGFEWVFFFSDDSPDYKGFSTRPCFTNLLKFLEERFEKPFMKPGDNFWFFFSGHGMRHAERDYLMPVDGYPGNVEKTAISINYITERLRRCGADNVVLILDACRNQGIKAGEGIGLQTAEEARQKGVISIFSCSPNQYSYEIEELQQGAFTYALLEGLSMQGKCATVKQLNQYLSWRVPELVLQHKHEPQTPYTIAEPVNKLHLILLPRYATLQDIDTLKIDAYQAEVNSNLELAEQLWIRVLAAASGTDMDAIRAIQRIAQSRINLTPNPPPPPETGNGQKSPTPEPGNQPTPTDDLNPEPGLDYAQLRDLLIAGKWKEADKETYKLILEVLRREQEGWCRKEDISKLPCSVVRQINQFWVEHSKGLFGFSVQQQIWRNIRGKADEFDVYKFADPIGWRGNKDWLKYDDFTFSLDAKEGHLPSFGYGNHPLHEWISSFPNFFFHVSKCL